MSDHLALHLSADRSIEWKDILIGSVRKPPEFLVDWHYKYIAEFDSRRDLSRGEQMKLSLDELRSLSKAGQRLTWEDLRSLQSLVLKSGEQQFRADPAHAKAGLEVYGFCDQLPAVFERRLEQYQTDDLSPITRAVRAYLDVIFFHPFVDGNARAARLVFDFILTSNSLALLDPRPVFAFERFAGEAQQYIELVEMVGALTYRLQQ